MMEVVLKIVLTGHIISGFLALLCGFISVTSVKGGRLHRLSGRLFFYSMLGVSFSAVFISIVKDNRFLLCIGLFAFYQTYSGYRAVKDKTLKPYLIDWLVLLIAAVNGFLMIYSMNLVLMVFGAINSLMVISNLRVNILIIQHKNIRKMEWLRRHIGMMMGSYIATVTAFIVVNATSNAFIPSWLIWLFPTIILTPLIVYYIRKYTLVFFIAIGFSSLEQPYINGGNTRHRVAQLNLGTDAGIFPANSSKTEFIN